MIRFLIFAVAVSACGSPAMGAEVVTFDAGTDVRVEAEAVTFDAGTDVRVEAEAGPGRSDFTVAGHAAMLTAPETITPGAPWVWYAITVTTPAVTLPGSMIDWYVAHFGALGITVAGFDVGESYGSPAGRVLFTAFYDEMIRRGYSRKPCFLAQSRGGLQAYNWAAEHAAAVGCIAGIFPVGDLRSYPGLGNASAVYEIDLTVPASLAANNPIDRLAPLAAAGIPIWHIHGDADVTVPLVDNSQVIHDRYVALGGSMTLVVATGHGHDSWPGYFESQELLDFVAGHAR